MRATAMPLGLGACSIVSAAKPSLGISSASHLQQKKMQRRAVVTAEKWP